MLLTSSRAKGSSKIAELGGVNIPLFLLEAFRVRRVRGGMRRLVLDVDVDAWLCGLVVPATPDNPAYEEGPSSDEFVEVTKLVPEQYVNGKYITE